MKKAMNFISVISVLLTVFSIALYCFSELNIAKTLAITFGTISYHFLIRLAVGYIFDKAMKNKADYFRKWYRCSPLEIKIYNLIGVKRWKSKMPSYNADYFNPKKKSWDEIAQAMCQAELVHEINVILSFIPILFSCWFGELLVFVITSVFAALFDTLFVAMQRYNRQRIIKLINKK